MMTDTEKEERKIDKLGLLKKLTNPQTIQEKENTQDQCESGVITILEK